MNRFFRESVCHTGHKDEIDHKYLQLVAVVGAQYNVLEVDIKEICLLIPESRRKVENSDRNFAPKSIKSVGSTSGNYFGIM